MDETVITKILSFLEEAGKIAMDYQKHLSIANWKHDSSIVTEADLTISKIFSEKFKDYMKLNNHTLLDEENLPSIKEFFDDKNEFLWTLDPVDGTTTYYNGLDLWSIGLSVYRNFEPYLGFIYVPSIGELVYTDGKNSYYIKNAFGKNEVKFKLSTPDRELTKKSIILQHRLKNYDIDKFVVLDLYSSYLLGFYTIIGKSLATFFNRPMKLWDISATLAIVKNIGMVFRNIKDDSDINSLKDIEIDDNWYLKNTYMISNEKLYKSIKDELILK
ncbi:MAG: hypothetical protein IJ853_04020 [Rickettsiales bacterium]|nr:hypothetical protein [Rickettsiales bacterium]